jgi:hypothetical protein
MKGEGMPNTTPLGSWARATARLTLALATGWVLLQALATPASGYEAAPTLQASKVLPAALRSGAHFRVDDKVTNDGYINTYHLHSKFGTFPAVSTAMLAKRIGEVNALVVMEQVKGTTEFTNALKKAGSGVVGSAKNLVTHPVESLSGAASGLGAVFRSASASLTGPKRSEAEESRVKDAIGFARMKRDYAYQFGVDVYSDNKVLQERLDDITWAGYGGSMTLSAALAAVPGAAGATVSVVTTNRALNDVFRTTAPADLRRMSGDKLQAMDVHPEIADAYLNNGVFSPREQTLLVHALDEMPGVSNRAAFIRFASATPNRNMAFFRQRQAEMYAGYHKTVAPLSSFVALGALAAARTGTGALVLCVPLDYLVWTEPMAKFMTAANKVIDDAGAQDKQLWVTGALSAEARKAMASRGWKVQERSEGRLFKWTEGNPQ